MNDRQLELKMIGINKSFAGVKALRDVDFSVRGGEVHALLGANGAGKSTLMKIGSGSLLADAGDIQLNGTTLHIRSPRDAMNAGICCVHQEVDTALVPSLSVTENVMMDTIIRTSKSALVNWSALQRDTQKVLVSIGAEAIDIHHQVQELSIAQKQLILIARALVQQAKIIIFDEPTAPLSQHEVERLFQVIRQLKTTGIACIFISHRLDEVFRLCDRLTIMRDGACRKTTAISDTNPKQVIETMIGKPLQEEFPKREVALGATLLDVRQVYRAGKVHPASFHVRRGEIVAVTGLVGAGKTELSRLIAGADRLDGGEVWLNGTRLRMREPADAIRAGIVLVPEERRKQGVLVQESVRSNLSLPSLRDLSTSLGIIKRTAENLFAKRIVSDLGIVTAHLEQSVQFLSGGNQQKVAVGKWLPKNAEVYVFDEPTKGVDVGAKSDMFRLIGELASNGKAILYFSCEFDEVLRIADRILVMSYGRIVKELTREEATLEQILFEASLGGGREDGEL